MTELRAFIFDGDGTLADTERDGHRVAFNHAFQDASLDWHWDTELYGRLLAVGRGSDSADAGHSASASFSPSSSNTRLARMSSTEMVIRSSLLMRSPLMESNSRLA